MARCIVASRGDAAFKPESLELLAIVCMCVCVCNAVWSALPTGRRQRIDGADHPACDALAVFHGMGLDAQ